MLDLWKFSNSAGFVSSAIFRGYILEIARSLALVHVATAQFRLPDIRQKKYELAKRTLYGILHG